MPSNTFRARELLEYIVGALVMYSFQPAARPKHLDQHPILYLIIKNIRA